MARDGASKVECADGKSRRAGSWHKFLKRMKNRSERRREKRDAECHPGYGKYSGWQT